MKRNYQEKLRLSSPNTIAPTSRAIANDYRDIRDKFRNGPCIRYKLINGQKVRLP